MENTSLPEWDCSLPLEMFYRGVIFRITLSGSNPLKQSYTPEVSPVLAEMVCISKLFKSLEIQGK
jgi:hypothetical protein